MAQRVEDFRFRDIEALDACRPWQSPMEGLYDFPRGVETPIDALKCSGSFNEELVALLAIAEGKADWLPDFILWAVHSGMRKGEMQALTWRDVRELGPDRVVIDVRHSKSGEPRFVPATKTMREVLERQKGRKVAGNDRVFPVSKMTLRGDAGKPLEQLQGLGMSQSMTYVGRIPLTPWLPGLMSGQWLVG